MNPRELSDAELRELAQRWRLEALRGDKAARGYAHVYEVECRRREGTPAFSHAGLDMRPLAPFGVRAWWRFW